MSWFSKIIGTEKVIDNVFDKEKGLLTQVGQWVGHQQFTDEEKSKHNQAMANAIQGFAVATMTENTDRSKTRRYLAQRWFDMHIFFIKLIAVYIPIDWLIVKLTNETEYVLTARMFELALNPWVCSITAGIGCFFWGSHALRSSKFKSSDEN